MATVQLTQYEELYNAIKSLYPGIPNYDQTRDAVGAPERHAALVALVTADDRYKNLYAALRRLYPTVPDYATAGTAADKDTAHNAILNAVNADDPALRGTIDAKVAQIASDLGTIDGLNSIKDVADRLDQLMGLRMLFLSLGTIINPPRYRANKTRETLMSKATAGSSLYKFSRLFYPIIQIWHHGLSVSNLDPNGIATTIDGARQGLLDVNPLQQRFNVDYTPNGHHAYNAVTINSAEREVLDRALEHGNAGYVVGNAAKDTPFAKLLQRMNDILVGYVSGGMVLHLFDGGTEAFADSIIQLINLMETIRKTGIAPGKSVSAKPVTYENLFTYHKDRYDRLVAKYERDIQQLNAVADQRLVKQNAAGLLPNLATAKANLAAGYAHYIGLFTAANANHEGDLATQHADNANPFTVSQSINDKEILAQVVHQADQHIAVLKVLDAEVTGNTLDLTAKSPTHGAGGWANNSSCFMLTH